jgi:rhodanese-related sulfurtransferase
VVTNVNADAGQTVFHLHFHVLGGEQLGAMNGNQKPETGNQKPETGQRPAANGQRPTANGKRPSALVLEGGLFLVAAIGLAIGFNQMNTRRIPWVKPAIERVAATDDMLGLAGGGADSVVGNQQTAQTSTDQTAENANTSQPDGGKKVPQPKSDSGVVLRGSAVPSEKPDKPAFTSQPGVVLEINRSQFERLLKVPNFLIDARTPESYAKGHIGNAVNVYGGEVESRIPELLGMVPKDRAVLIYCDGGECELSHHVANALKGFGYGPIYIYTGGWAEWNK